MTWLEEEDVWLVIWQQWALGWETAIEKVRAEGYHPTLERAMITSIITSSFTEAKMLIIQRQQAGRFPQSYSEGVPPNFITEEYKDVVWDQAIQNRRN